jgi:hypothetical protein
MSIFVEDWQGNYGSPYLVTLDDVGSASVSLAEDTIFKTHPNRLVYGEHEQLAFVDGVRRGEAALYQHFPESGRVVRGVAGSHACGAVIADGASRAIFASERVQRLVIWGSGETGDLEPIGGFAWMSRSVDDEAPDAPLKQIQERMRREEVMLAEELSRQGLRVVLDGPLFYVRSWDLPIVGYIKTHSRALLAPEMHKQIPTLRPGERSTIFRLGDDRYSCYLRLSPMSEMSGPWAGIVRLEVPQATGLRRAIETVNWIAGVIPRYAGIPYKDPRAPQNLQPVGALEKHLRHRLGDPGLAYRAVRAAVSSSRKEMSA